MIITTTDLIPNKEIIEYKGMVKGASIRAKHIGKDILAGFKNLVGGEITSYKKMLDEAREIAINRMIEEANKLGANAIVGCRISSSQIMQGASEIIAYGTAVVLKED